MNGYIAFFKGKKVEIYSETLYDAKQQAIKALKVPKSQQGLLAVELAETNVKDGKGTQVTLNAATRLLE